MLSRKDFIKGALLGCGATLASIGGVKLLKGDYYHLFVPNGAMIDAVPAYQDEMKLVLLGTGSPMSSIHRAKPANAILAGDKTFVVDCGGEVVPRLLRAGIPVERINGVFFSHHHSDHNSGFIDLLISSTLKRQARPARKGALPLYGPTNTKKIIGKMMDAFSWDIRLREEQAKVKTDLMKADIREMDQGVIYEKDGLKVTIFPVDHGIVKPACGYRFEYKGKVIVISGDTRPCDNVIRYSKGADILVHEAYSSKWIELGLKLYPDPDMERIAKGIMEYHSSTLEAAEVAEKAGVKRLVFTHIMPTVPPAWYFEWHWSSGVGKIFKGKVTVGRDLMVFS